MMTLWMSLLAVAAPSPDEMRAMLKTVDDRAMNNGDYRSVFFLEQKEQGKSDLVYEGEVLRRDVDDKLVILFTRPQSEAGKGYLRLDGNLFFYDPAVGRWERRTERERIGGTDSNREDFDQSHLHEQYTPSFVADEPLGAFQTVHLTLAQVEGMDVAYPKVDLWIDKASGNVLKRQDFALSGRLVRTTYNPKFGKMFSPSKGADVWFAQEIRIFDELQKGNTTTIVIRSTAIDPLGDEVFTKAWLEARSR
jgi:hypothetical protein